MPASLTHLARNSATVTFQVGDDPDQSLKIEYYSRKVTNSVLFTVFDLQELTQSSPAEARKRVKELDEMLVSLIKSWDLYEDDNFTIKAPITKERLAEIDIHIRTQILLAISRNARGPEA